MQNKIVIILLLSLLIGIFASSSAQETKIKNTNIQSRHAVSMNVDYFFKNEYKTSFGMGVNLNYYYEFIPDKLRINPSFGVGIYSKPLYADEGYLSNTMYVRCFLDWTFFRKNWFYLNLGAGFNGTFSKVITYTDYYAVNGVLQAEGLPIAFGYSEFIPGLGVNLGLGFTLPNQRLSIEFYPAEVWWKFPDIGFGFKSSLGLKIKI